MKDPEPPKGTSRRDFMSTLFMGGGLLASALVVVRHGLAYLFPRIEKPVFRRLLVGRTSELGLGQARAFQLGEQRLYLVHTEEGYRVLSGICTHLGCRVSWEPHHDRFFCPCHAGVFGPDGRVVDGPPPSPLVDFEVEVDDTLIYMWIREDRQGGLA